MAYYIKKPGILVPGDVYWTGGSNWSDDISKKKTYATKATCDNKIKNPDGKNGGFNKAVVVSE